MYQGSPAQIIGVNTIGTVFDGKKAVVGNVIVFLLMHDMAEMEKFIL